MARAGFIDHRRAKVEAKNGDACIIGFTGDLNSLVNERFDNVLSESQEEVFNTHYGVHMDTVWEFNRFTQYMYRMKTTSNKLIINIL